MPGHRPGAPQAAPAASDTPPAEPDGPPGAQAALEVTTRPFWAQVTAYDGSKYYAWSEVAPDTGGTFGAYTGGQSGTVTLNPAVTANGEALAINSYVLLRREYFDPTYDFVFLVLYEAPASPSGTGIEVKQADGTHDQAGVGVLVLDQATGLAWESGTTTYAVQVLAASATQQGGVTTGAQAFAGDKTFDDNVSGLKQVRFPHAQPAIDVLSAVFDASTWGVASDDGNAGTYLTCQGNVLGTFGNEATVLRHQNSAGGNWVQLILTWPTGGVGVTSACVLHTGPSALYSVAYGIGQGGTIHYGVTGTSGGGDTVIGGIVTALGSGGGTGTVTSITAGAGLTGGTITASGTVALDVPVTVARGGTGDTTLAAYAVLCGGTTSTGAVQSVAGLGSSGDVLTSNGAGALPTFQTPGIVSGTVGPAPQWVKHTVAYTDLQTAATSKTVTLLALPAGSNLERVKYRVTAAFTMSAGSITGLTVGFSGGAVTGSNVSLYAGIANSVATLPSFNTGSATPDCENQTAGWSVTLTATSTGGNLANLTAGSVDIWLLVSQAA